jgi:7-keto-8-aminopelargonate synthetase-like enzyme
MKFQGKEVLNWSLNDYLGLANRQDMPGLVGSLVGHDWSH